MPVLIIGALTWPIRPFPWLEFLAALVGVGCLHLGANLINDYFDAKGSDPINKRFTPFSGGSRVIQDGLLGESAVLTMSIGFFAAAFVIGLALIIIGRPWVALVGLLGFLAGWLYSADPLQLMSRGLGEVIIFFAFGPLVTWGTGYVVTGHLTWQAFLSGIPPGWLIMAVIWINQFPDIEADKAAGKTNLVVRMGLERASYVYLALMLLPYPTIVVLALIKVLPWWANLAWLTLPLSLGAVMAAVKDPENVLPAQAMTIQTHLATAAVMIVGIMLGHYL